MLAIRLRRTGSKKRPFYRVVVTDSRTARDSRFVEVLGHYNPRTKPETLKLDRERLAHWVKTGAQQSDTVRTLVARMPPAPAAAGRGGRRAARVVSRARDVVEVVARALADHPDAVRVTEREHKGQTLVELFMAPGDLGRVIGRQGRTAAAMRTLVTRPRSSRGSRRRSSSATSVTSRVIGAGIDGMRRRSLLIGRVARAHGIRGQVIVNPDTDFIDQRFRTGSCCWWVRRTGRAARDRDGAVPSGPADRGVRGHRDDERRGAAGRRRVVAPASRDRPAAGRHVSPSRAGWLRGRRQRRRVHRPVRRSRARWSGAAWSFGAQRDADSARRAVSASAVDPAARRIVVDPPEGLIDLNRPARTRSAVKIDIVTIFPKMVESALAEGIVIGRAIAAGVLDVHVHDLRDLHDRSASGRRRHAVWRRPRHGAEAGTAVHGGGGDSRRARERRRGDPDHARRRAVRRMRPPSG